MDRQEYLNKISSSGRPQQANIRQKPNFLSSMIFKIIAIGVGLFIIIAIAGSILNNIKNKEKENCFAFKLHIDNIIKVVNENKKYLRSSTLRSNSVSLVSILTNTSGQFTNFITNNYDYTDKSITEKMSSSENKVIEELKNDLFSAKINNLLDATFARKMTYEISIIQSKELEIMDTTKSSELYGILEESYNSLENLYNNFYNISDNE